MALKRRTAGDGQIHPHIVYDPEAAGRAMGMSKRWVMDNLVNTDEVAHKRKGDFIGIPGWSLIQWVESDLRTKSEWQESEEPGSAGKGRRLETNNEC